MFISSNNLKRRLINQKKKYVVSIKKLWEEISLKNISWILILIKDFLLDPDNPMYVIHFFN